MDPGEPTDVPGAAPFTSREQAVCPVHPIAHERFATGGPSGTTRSSVASGNGVPIATHPLSTWSLLLGILGLVCFGAGPLLGLAAMATGWLARLKIATIRRAGGQMGGTATAAAGMLAGGLSVLSLAVVLFVYARITHHRSASHPKTDSQVSPHVAATPPGDPAANDAPSVEPPKVSSSSSLTQVGEVTVVDVAGGVPSLAKELEAQRTAAASHGERMLVETITGTCAPCQSVSRALAEGTMQRALRSVRLVRIDRDQFEEDLDELEIPSRPWPSFFLLDSDLRVRDAIDGDEWDDDVAANIAPVLGAFLRGTYTKRRNPWHHAPRPSGTVL